MVYNNNTILKHIATLVLFFSFVFGVATPALAQEGAISGDSRCGGSLRDMCDAKDLKDLVQDGVILFIAIFIPIMVVMIVIWFTQAYWSAADGNASAYKEARRKSMWVLFALVLVLFIVGGGLFAIVQLGGGSEPLLKSLRFFSMEPFVQTAYAQDTLPSPTTHTTVLSLVQGLFSIVMSFFVFPLLIAAWVWTGFSYINAQGKPDALTKAHKLLMYVVISTFVVMLIQGFLVAVQGTVNAVLSK
ncbi:MAG: hypothetical protein RI935_643 [Candidatus Parcubacteria bacterium]|jgi:hypothetical protein